jgi:DNA repair exonuclease SbcCD ATPase subunit
MAIAAVIRGTVEVEGKVFEFDSPKGSAWLESVTSFRFEPSGTNKPYTARKESGKGGNYWYGYRKVAGKLHKKYIGKGAELSTAKLEEIAEALNTPPQPRVTGKVTETGNQLVTEKVTEKVTENCSADRLTALELQVQVLQESLEALRSALSGKSEGLGDSPELLKPDEVTDDELQIELGNLKTENESLRQKLAKSRDVIEALNRGTEALNEQLAATNQTIESLKQELAENTRYYTARLNEAGATLGTFKDKLEAAQTKNQRLQNDLGNSQAEVIELRSQLAVANQKISASDEEVASQFEKLKHQDAEIENLKSELARLTGENSEKSAAASELPEAADLYNQLKARRKKSKADLGDVEVILEMIEE